MNTIRVSAIVLATTLALVGCGGQSAPGPQPAFSDGGRPPAPGGSRWSETERGASGEDVDVTQSGLSAASLVITYQQYFSTAHLQLDRDYYVTTSNFLEQVSQLSISGRCSTRYSSDGDDASMLMRLVDFDTGTEVRGARIAVVCNASWVGPTSLVAVTPGHRYYMTAQTFDALHVPVGISLVAYRRQ